MTGPQVLSHFFCDRNANGKNGQIYGDSIKVASTRVKSKEEPRILLPFVINTISLTLLRSLLLLCLFLIFFLFSFVVVYCYHRMCDVSALSGDFQSSSEGEGAQAVSDFRPCKTLKESVERRREGWGMRLVVEPGLVTWSTIHGITSKNIQSVI